MFSFLFALALVGQIDRIDLNGSHFIVESPGKLRIHQSELPKTKKQKKRIVFDIKPAKLGPKVPHALISKDKNISKIRIAQHSKNVVRVVAEVEGKQRLSMKQVEPEKKAAMPKLPKELLKPDKPVKLVKASVKQDKPKEEEPVAIVPDPEEKKVLRIVIDPGHGGDDPGAIGKRGLKEKDVTLALSKRMKTLIEKRLPGTQVFMTRDHDKTLTLPSRTDFANRMQADLFISVHVNASLNRETQGIETYYLNITHDRYALRLAARENAMSESETSNLEYILADLAMKSSVSDSVRLGRIVQDSLCGNLLEQWDDIKNLGLKQAMFYVLMGAKMPAILVETSFISNRTDEKRLKDDAYQHAVAEGIVKGIERYSEEKVAIR
jgi:N-acetylmuramoyl-L-alanine amidase